MMYDKRKRAENKNCTVFQLIHYMSSDFPSYIENFRSSSVHLELHFTVGCMHHWGYALKSVGMWEENIRPSVVDLCNL